MRYAVGSAGGQAGRGGSPGSLCGPGAGGGGGDQGQPADSTHHPPHDAGFLGRTRSPLPGHWPGGRSAGARGARDHRVPPDAPFEGG